MTPLDIKNLKDWFLKEKRELPWRENPTPYAVWISEVMLQQTQVAVVIPYFERWMIQFPTIHHLANATSDQVIKAWEGLGYYSRARNLHEGAKYIVSQFNGIMPSSEIELASIKGLGPYTIGAIRAFAFHQRAAAVDGNVMRVLSRYFLIKESISKTKTVQQIRSLAEKLLPEQEPWIISEALIELGASYCNRTPKCCHCPLRGNCQAFAQGMSNQIPRKEPRKKIQILHRIVAVIRHQETLLVHRTEVGKIMSGLHEFPYFEGAFEEIRDNQVIHEVFKHFHIDAHLIQPLTHAKHAFTNFRVKLYPFLLRSKAKVQVEGYHWLSLDALKTAAFSSGHRRVFNEVKLLFADS